MFQKTEQEISRHAVNNVITLNHPSFQCHVPVPDEASAAVPEQKISTRTYTGHTLENFQ